MFIMSFLITAIVLVVFGVIIFVSGFKKMHKYLIIKDIPTSKIRSLAIGLVELFGKVNIDKPIKTPFSKVDTVFYKYVVKEYTRHESTSKNGHTTTYSWDIIYSDSSLTPFYLEDETGKVLVNPEGADAKISLKKVFLEKRGMKFGDMLSMIKKAFKGELKTKDLNVSNLEEISLEREHKIFKIERAREGDRKYYEYYILPGEQLYVLGTAKNPENQLNKVIIAKGENEKTFILSEKSEKELLKSMFWSIIGIFVLSILLIVGGVVLFFI